MPGERDDDGSRPAAGGPPGAAPGAAGGSEVDLVVDMANTVGSRPDGWWRDRAGAARRLLEQLSALAAQPSALAAHPAVGAPGGGPGAPLLLGEVHAVLEGAARRASAEGLHTRVRVHEAPADGDSTIASLTEGLVAAGRGVVVVTADRGLRARLPAAAASAGPGWLRDLLDGLPAGE